MGESILDASPSSLNLEDKMGKAVPSNPVLEVSVSFGRFENDSLSWEKWSSFSPNKYLEEVEKCATPGSVAKKAAYFEAHYKKIAARKAELLDQEKQMDNDSSRLDNQTCGDLMADNCKNKSESDISDHQRSDDIVYPETSLVNEVRGMPVEQPGGDAAIKVECQSSPVERVKEEKSRLQSPTSNKPEEAVVVTVKEDVENSSMRMVIVKELQEKEMEPATNVKEENVKLDHPKNSHKIAPVNKEKNISKIKKKPASPAAKSSPITKASRIAKSPHLSTPKVSKPTPTSTLSSSRSSTKIGNGSSLPRSKNLSAGESKKVAPKSLHMSLSLGPSSSDPVSLTTTRKSLIMEKMGDKDIVKRAFKTFQNNYNQLKSSKEERSPAPKQVTAKGAEPRVPSLTPRKENAGYSSVVVQCPVMPIFILGKFNFALVGLDRSFKAAGVEKKSAKAAPSSLSLKIDERAEKRREENKEVDIKKVRQNSSSKARSAPSLYPGQKILKGCLNKISPGVNVKSPWYSFVI
ncbi:F3I6.9 protein [Citrus sinensis]|uniref:F3I6.9 protein n=1 Tax=Citrus sinensis TaxID=2711 RepID=A0ACB8LJN2_CITSI|nr:F3I6.9 protein [Citrus sinensis]